MIRKQFYHIIIVTTLLVLTLSNIYAMDDATFKRIEEFVNSFDGAGFGYWASSTLVAGPSITQDSNGKIHIVWGKRQSKRSNSPLFYQRIGANGALEVEKMRLPILEGSFPSIQVDSKGDLYITWQITDIVGRPSHATELYCTKISPNNGDIIWEKFLGEYATARTVVGFNDNLHILCSPSRFPGALYYLKVDVNGDSVTVRGELNILTEVEYARIIRYSLAVDSRGNIHIIFFEFRGTGDGSGYYASGYYMKLANNGRQLIAPRRIVERILNDSLTYDDVHYSLWSDLFADSSDNAIAVWDVRSIPSKQTTTNVIFSLDCPNYSNRMFVSPRIPYNSGLRSLSIFVIVTSSRLIS